MMLSLWTLRQVQAAFLFSSMAFRVLFAIVVVKKQAIATHIKNMSQEIQYHIQLKKPVTKIIAIDPGNTIIGDSLLNSWLSLPLYSSTRATTPQRISEGRISVTSATSIAITGAVEIAQTFK